MGERHLDSFVSRQLNKLLAVFDDVDDSIDFCNKRIRADPFTADSWKLVREKLQEMKCGDQVD